MSGHSALRTAMREAPQPWLQSPFSGQIGAQREVAFASVELDGLRNAARIVDGATLNDAILAVVAGGLHRWLQDHHGHFEAVRVKVPVSLHAAATDVGGQGAEPGNRDSFFCRALAAFAGGRRPHPPGGRTATPATLRYAAAVSRRMCVAR